jgi:hypothetical protein
MQMIVRNLVDYLLICRLNSGRTLHLGPADESEPIDLSELTGNEKINKLLRARLISIGPSKSGGLEAPQSDNEGEVAEAVHTASAMRTGGRPQALYAVAPARAADLTFGKASLSRFQFLIFTFVIAGLFLMLSIQKGAFVDIPANVLGLLGLSAASYLVSQAV